MDLKKIIIQTLNEYEFGNNLKNGDYIRGVKKTYFYNVAQTIIDKVAKIETLKQKEYVTFLDWLDSDESNNLRLATYSDIAAEYLKTKQS
tara:strand:+ start:1491 stop:1760 length:270 start_codon:yes stop_codon:yes gene_type:complete